MSFPGRPGIFGPGKIGVFFVQTPRIFIQSTDTESAEVGEAIAESRLSGVAEKSEALLEYGWRVRFVEEPDSKVTGYLEDYNTGEELKSAVGADFEDAWLGLGIGTTPPSAELRGEQGLHAPEKPPV
jgi:hypothetical protein